LLKVAVVGLGFGISLSVVTATGLTGLWVTGCGVVLILAAGTLLGRLGGIAGDIRFLLSSGTAICGGSAIAAVSPILGARREAVSIALAVVFVLNGLALYLFPVAGNALELTQREFAVWAAIAIHDTSSVVGAASVYGAEALEHATVLKLARALWIIPLAAGLAVWMQWRNRDTSRHKAIRWPWFIGLFVLAAAARSAFPGLASEFELVSSAARRLMVLVLFLIGSGMSLAALRSIGWRPLAHAGLLWVLVSLAALGLARSGWNPVAG
jgi:uncharacterized integral membrane protein (TIGR00698 family)